MVPEKSAPLWKAIASGKKAVQTDSLGLQMLLKRVTSRAAGGDAAEVEKGVGELYDFFTKYEKILGKEIAALK